MDTHSRGKCRGNPTPDYVVREVDRRLPESQDLDPAERALASIRCSSPRAGARHGPGKVRKQRTAASSRIRPERQQYTKQYT